MCTLGLYIRPPPTVLLYQLPRRSLARLTARGRLALARFPFGSGGGPAKIDQGRSRSGTLSRSQPGTGLPASASICGKTKLGSRSADEGSRSVNLWAMGYGLRARGRQSEALDA